MDGFRRFEDRNNPGESQKERDAYVLSNGGGRGDGRPEETSIAVEKRIYLTLEY